MFRDKVYNYMYLKKMHQNIFCTFEQFQKSLQGDIQEASLICHMWHNVLKLMNNLVLDSAPKW